VIQHDRIYLSTEFNKKDVCSLIPGSKWHSGIREWSWPVSQYRTIIDCFPRNAAQLKLEFEKYCQFKDVKMENPKKEEVYSIPDECSRMTDPPVNIFKLKPYEHQIMMMKAGAAYKKLAFFCEMGTGKTKVMVDLIAWRGKRTIVFAPKSVIYSWGKEIDKNSDMDYTVATGTKKKKLATLTADVPVVITNYETLLSFGAKDKVWEDFEQVILDESSRIKSHKASRTKEIIKAFANKEFKYLLSGTPITQSPCDIFTQMQFLDPKILGHRSFYSFRNTYCEMGGYQNYQIVRYKNLDTLKMKISRASVQLKKDECIDLPPKIYNTHNLEMGKEMKEQYLEMKRNAILELSAERIISAPIVLTKLLRMQQILSGSFLPEGAVNEKLETLTEIVKNAVGYNRQVVIWGRFRDSLELIGKRMTELKIPFSMFHGDTKDRQLEIDNFQDGKTKVFIGQESTGGLGITLHAGSVMVYYENTFSLEERKQSEDRIHRIGQTKSCNYIDLVYKKTIDEMLLKAIQEKQNVATYLVDSFEEGVYATK